MELIIIIVHGINVKGERQGIIIECKIIMIIINVIYIILYIVSVLNRCDYNYFILFIHECYVFTSIIIAMHLLFLLFL